MTDVTVTIQSEAKCGFNKNEFAYCDMAKGDTYYMSYLAMARNFYSQDFECSLETGGSTCYAAQ